jgi:CheY-like chemotaxis protein
MRILVADDDAIGRIFLTRVLTKWGYDVMAVADGTAAWNALQEEGAPRLLILDRMMPGLNGLDLCARIRASASPHYYYIILLTALGETADVIEGLEAGADTYLVKPVGPPELRVRLKAAQRIFALETRLEYAVEELRHQLQPTETGVASPVAAVDPAAAKRETGTELAPLASAPRILREVLAELGVEQSVLTAGNGDNSSFHARSAIVLRGAETWVDFDMYLAREPSEVIYRGLVGEAPRSDADLLDAMAEVLNMCQGALKLSLENDGHQPLTPILPTASLEAVPSPLRMGATSFRVYEAIRFAFTPSPAKIVMTPISELRPRDILADPIAYPGNDQVVFLSRGIALNDRYIDRIIELVSAGRLDTPTIPVIHAAHA